MDQPKDRTPDRGRRHSVEPPAQREQRNGSFLGDNLPDRFLDLVEVQIPGIRQLRQDKLPVAKLELVGIDLVVGHHQVCYLATFAPGFLKLELAPQCGLFGDLVQFPGELQLPVLFGAVSPQHPHVDQGPAILAVDKAQHLERPFAEGGDFRRRLHENPMVVLQITVKLDPAIDLRAVDLPEVAAASPPPRLPEWLAVAKRLTTIAGVCSFVHKFNFVGTLCEEKPTRFPLICIIPDFRRHWTDLDKINPEAVPMGEEFKKFGGTRRPATTQEIEKGIGSMSKVDSLRLKRFAKSRTDLLGLLAHGQTWQDFVQEAVLLTLNGQRHWHPWEKSFVTHLMDTVWSITGHVFESVKARYEPVPICALLDYPDELSPNRWPNTVPVDCPTPEEQLLIKEEEAERARLIALLYQSVADITVGPDVLRCKLEGMTGREIRETLGLDERSHAAIDKRIRREVPKICRSMTLGD